MTYALEEDAQQALKDIKEYDGTKLSISVAKKKLVDKRGKKKTGLYEIPQCGELIQLFC